MPQRCTLSEEEIARRTARVALLPRKRCRYTPKQVADALRACKGFENRAAYLLDINTTTLRKYMKRWPALKKLQRTLRGRLNDNVEQRVYEDAMQGSIAHQRLWLQGNMPEKYGRKGRNTIGVNINNVTNTLTVPAITDETKKTLAEEARRRQQERLKQQQAVPEIGLKELPPAQQLPIVIDNQPLPESPAK